MAVAMIQSVVLVVRKSFRMGKVASAFAGSRVRTGSAWLESPPKGVASTTAFRLTTSGDVWRLERHPSKAALMPSASELPRHHIAALLPPRNATTSRSERRLWACHRHGDAGAVVRVCVQLVVRHRLWRAAPQN